MIGFGFPHALWLLVLVPGLFFLRRPRTRRTLVVSSLHLWPSSLPPSAVARPLSRLHGGVLPSLRAAFLLSAVLACAQPYCAGPNDVRIVIDASASMSAALGTSTRWSAARTHVDELLGSMPVGTQVTLVGDAAGVLVTAAAGHRDLAQRLGALQPTAASILPDAGVRHAAGARGGRTHVVTDQPAPVDLPSTVEWIRVGGPVANSGISRLAVRRVAVDVPEWHVLVEVIHYGPKAEQRHVDLVADGRVLASRLLTLAPAVPTTIVLPVSAPAGTVLAAKLREPDAMTIDDDRRAVLRSPGLMRVLLLTRGNRALETVLAANPDIVTRVRRPSEGVTDAVGADDVLVCDFPCNVQASRFSGVLIVTTPAEGPPVHLPLRPEEEGHPVLRGLAVDDQAVTVRSPSPVTGNARVLLSAGQVPVLIATEAPGQRALELRLSPSESGLARLPIYPILMANAIDWLARRDEVREVSPGEPLSWQVPLGRSLEGLEVRDPAGASASWRLAGRTVTVLSTYAAGVYRVAGQGWSEAFVVNVDPVESDVWTPTPTPAPSFAASEEGSRRPTPLSAVVTVMALFWLTVEWWYRSRYAAIA